MPKISTSTQIRTIYSDGLSYMTMKFFNTSFSFNMVPFKSNNASGRPEYDRNKSVQTTVNYDSAFALYKASRDIIDGVIKDPCVITVPCAADAKIMIECRPSQNIGELDTFFILNKNGTTVEFKFSVYHIDVTLAGVSNRQPVYAGLGVLNKTLEGYLTGINSDRHLDKMTEEYIKSQEGNSNNNNNYQKKKVWNTNNVNSQPAQSWETQPNQENASTYKIEN